MKCFPLEEPFFLGAEQESSRHPALHLHAQGFLEARATRGELREGTAILLPVGPGLGSSAVGAAICQKHSLHLEQEMSRRIREMIGGLECNGKQLLFLSRL